MSARAGHVLSLLAGVLSCSGPSPGGSLSEALSHPRLGLGRRGLDAASIGFEREGEVFRIPRTSKVQPLFTVEIDASTGTRRVTRKDARGLTLEPVTSPFVSRHGEVRSGMAVFPAEDDRSAVVLTPRPDGVKEDILLTRPLGDSLRFEWTLRIDPGLSARLAPAGDVVVRGPLGRAESTSQPARADAFPVLYRIPAPIVRDASGATTREHVRFELSGDRLALVADRLSDLRYPLSIDPTIVVTSTLDFAVGGNNEGGVEIRVDEIRRGSSRGAIGYFAAVNGLASARRRQASAVYNDIVYLTGGLDGAAPKNDVQIARMGSGGTLTSWSSTTPFSTARFGHACVAYNGFLYIVGGKGTALLSDVQVAPINDDGTLGTFSATTALPSGRFGHAAVAASGYLYVTGGDNGTAALDEILVAPFKGDGSLGAFAPTAAFPTARYGHASVGYGGFLYVIGGTNGSRILSDIRATPLGPDGALSGSWSGSSFPGGRSGHTAVASNGFLFIVGGLGGSGSLDDVQVAPFRAGGLLGTFSSGPPLGLSGVKEHASAARGDSLFVLGGVAGAGATLFPARVASIGGPAEVSDWVSTAPFAGARENLNAVTYNGYVYVLGGGQADVQMAKPAEDGRISSWKTTTAVPTLKFNSSAVAYNGYLYFSGGNLSSGQRSNTVHLAPFASDGTLGAWSPTTPLPTPVTMHATAAVNGVFYVIGGSYDGNAPLPEVQFAPMGADGTLGTFTRTTSLPLPLFRHAVVADGGRLYVVGGTYNDDPQHSSSANVYVGTLGTNGALSAWTKMPSLPKARASHGIAVLGGILYSLGGINHRSFGEPWISLSDVDEADLSAGGGLGAWRPGFSLPSGRKGALASVATHDTIYALGGTGPSGPTNEVHMATVPSRGGASAWGDTTSLPTARYGHAAVFADEHLYVLGGWNGTALRSDVQMAEVDPSGSVSSWRASTPLPGGRRSHGAAAAGEFLYLVGGIKDAVGTAIDEVHVAKFDASGGVGTWSTSRNLPKPRSGHATVSYAGYLYTIGGDSTGAIPDVLLCRIDPAGTLGPWTPTTALPSARSGHAAVAYNGFLYVIGGKASALLNEVLAAPINSDGTLGLWRATSSFAGPRSGLLAAGYNGYLYVLMGASGALHFGDVQLAAINADGTLGSFWTSPHSTGGRTGAATAISGSFLYLAGGNNGSGSPLSDVQVAELQAPAPIGEYSRLIDIGAEIGMVDTLRVNGSRANRGALQLAYRAAPASGVFGPLVDMGEILPGAVVYLGDRNVRYLWFRLRLDDSSAAVVNSDAGNERDVTDVTLSYTTDKCAGVTCAPLDPCHVAGTCNPVTGVCSNPVKPDGVSCDDRDPCTKGDACKAGSCAGAAYACTPEGCAATSVCDGLGTCKTSPKAAGTECRQAAGACDRSEACDGVSSTCPADQVEPAGKTCRASGGPCDRAESCDGTSTACPADAMEPFGKACRAAVGACDAEERCDGKVAACPSDGLEGTSKICRAPAGACDAPETCDGTSASCPADRFEPAAKVCRPAVGSCDREETCAGGGAQCPTDLFEPVANKVCRPSAGLCDAPEACTGTGGLCPVDAVLTMGNACRPSRGPCDVAEVCDGASAACPADALESAGKLCRAVAGVCDTEERCDGKSVVCHPDALDGPSKLCRPSVGTCDAPETCDGKSTACPTDLFESSTKICRPAVGACDVEETCSGKADCPENLHAPDTKICRPSAAPCDTVERCSGSSASCPPDRVAPAGLPCRPVRGPCDVAEACDGSASACPEDRFASPGQACSGKRGACEETTTCSGAAAECPDGQFLPAGTPCRPASGPCDVAEVCAGTARTCPPDGFVAARSPGTPSCAPFVCSGEHGQCLVACRTDEDCAAGLVCISAECTATRTLAVQSRCGCGTDPPSGASAATLLLLVLGMNLRARRPRAVECGAPAPL